MNYKIFLFLLFLGLIATIGIVSEKSDALGASQEFMQQYSYYKSEINREIMINLIMECDNLSYEEVVIVMRDYEEDCFPSEIKECPECFGLDYKAKIVMDCVQKRRRDLSWN